LPAVAKETVVNDSGQTRSPKDLQLRFLELLSRNDYDGMSEVLADDVVTEWPQSRERIRGLAALREVLLHYPGGPVQPASYEAQFIEGDDEAFVLTPMFTMVHAEGHGNTATSVVKTRYPDGSDWLIITNAKERDGKIAQITQYFAPVYDAPEWRAHWVERME
jgi:ketosteroid isomerase-like protein